MYCPKCGAEYRPGFTRCADCDVDLVAEPPNRGQPDIPLVKVFETVNPALIPVVESLFYEENIEFLTRNETLQDMFGGGRIAGFNNILGPVQFWVRQDDADKARELLADLQANT